MILRLLRLRSGQVRSGQVLIELLIALGVAVMAIAALVQIATKSLSNAGFSKSQSGATAYAVAANEWLRGQRSSLGWDIFFGKAGQAYCLNDLNWNLPGPCGTAQIGTSGFSREVSLIRVSDRQVEAAVIVKWRESTETFSSKQTTVFGRY